jgi:hypothetical protein
MVGMEKVVLCAIGPNGIVGDLEGDVQVPAPRDFPPSGAGAAAVGQPDLNGMADWIHHLGDKPEHVRWFACVVVCPRSGRVGFIRWLIKGQCVCSLVYVLSCFIPSFFSFHAHRTTTAATIEGRMLGHKKSALPATSRVAPSHLPPFDLMPLLRCRSEERAQPRLPKVRCLCARVCVYVWHPPSLLPC